MLSQPEENYIKAIFSLCERDKGFETSIASLSNSSDEFLKYLDKIDL
jgi:hypothetical protein